VTTRLAWFWISNYLSHIVGAFLAVGIFQLEGVNGQPGWRYLFLIEGAFTFLVGLVSFWLMPPGPTQTRSRVFPNGWFTERYVLVSSAPWTT
jgi:sugar phosphate permease